MTSQRELDIMWLEAMEEVDEVEVEFWETLRGKDASKNETAETEIAGRTDTAYS